MLSDKEVDLWFGVRPETRDVVRPGNNLFIPANVAHVTVNRSRELAIFVGSRNEPTAQESVVKHPDLDEPV